MALGAVRNPDDAADALQEAMISAFRRAADFRGEAAVTTWLHRIVINSCLDQLRRKAARPADGYDEAALDAVGHAPQAADPGPENDTALDVRAALRLLPDEQRAALVLVDMLGYPVEAAAEILRVRPGTVKSRCARGRARLLPHVAHLRERPPAGLRNQTAAADVSSSQGTAPTAAGPGPAGLLAGQQDPPAAGQGRNAARDRPS